MKRSAGWNQEVTDEEGRRRFHGAFTGGFSAGYYNSVGSKEGWQPKTFSSSRHERSHAVQQRAEDFMDVDDDPLLGQRLETTAQYSTAAVAAAAAGKRSSQHAYEPMPRSSATTTARTAFEARVLCLPQSFATTTTTAAAAAAPSSLNLFESFVQPVNDSIGTKLLNQMGWKEGHAIGPRVRRTKLAAAAASATTNSDAAAAMDDDSVVYVPRREAIDAAASLPPPKRDRYGAGFDPFAAAPEFAAYRQLQSQAQTHATTAERQVVSFAAAIAAPPRGSDAVTTGFGLSALEEHDDLDVYGSVPMSDFDTVLGGRNRKSQNATPKRLTHAPDAKQLEAEGSSPRSRSPTVGADGRLALPGFVFAVAPVEKKPIDTKLMRDRLVVPRGFRPQHVFHDDDDDADDDDAGTKLYAQHNFVLETTQAPNAAAPAAAAAVKRVAAPRVPPRVQQPPAHDASVPSLPAAVRERQPLVQSVAGAQLVANISASIAKRFVSASSVETSEPPAAIATATVKRSQRSESVWVPSALLCKRFHVQCTNGSSRSQPLDASETKRDLFDQELVPHLVEFAAERQQTQQEQTDTAVGRSEASGATRSTRFGPRLTDATRNADNHQPVPGVTTNAATAPAAVTTTTTVDNDKLAALPGVVAKPTVSLLKSIFEPSDASDDEDEEEEEEENVSDKDKDNESRGRLSSTAAAVVPLVKQNETPTSTKFASPTREVETGRRTPSRVRSTSSSSSSSDDDRGSGNVTSQAPSPSRASAALPKETDVHTSVEKQRGASIDSREGCSSTTKAKKRDKKKHKKKDKKRSSSSSKKHKHKHKHRRHADSDNDQDDSDSDSDHARRKSRRDRHKKSSKRSSSSRRRRSASREKPSRSSRESPRH